MKTQLTIPYQPFHYGSYNIHLIFLSILFITACSVFKEKSYFQSDSLLRINSSHEIKSKINTHAQSVRIYNSVDSLDKGSYAEIIPEGFFNYSAQEGFSGNASKVVVKERVTSLKRIQDKVQQIQSDNLESQSNLAKKTTIQTRLKEKRSEKNTYSILYLSGFVLIFVVIFLFKKIITGTKNL